MRKIKFLPAVYSAIGVFAALLFVLQLQNKSTLTSSQDPQNVTKVSARSTGITPWQEVRRTESPVTTLLEILPVELQEKVDATPTQDTGYVAGRKVSVIPISKFPSIYEGYKGITSMTEWNDKLFMTSNYGFGYVNDADLNWNNHYFVDTRPVNNSNYGYTWATFAKTYPSERIYVGGVRDTLAYTPSDGTIARVLDPFNTATGRLEAVFLAPLQGKSKIVASPSREYPLLNAVWYYNFDTGVVRKWTTPYRGCSFIYDDVGSLFTLTEDDEYSSSVYALYDEKTLTGPCSNVQIIHDYKIIKITFDDVNPLIISTIKPFAVETTGDFLGFALHSTFSDGENAYNIFGTATAASRYSPYMLHFDPSTSSTQTIKSIYIGDSAVYDNYAEHRVNTSGEGYTNITALTDIAPFPDPDGIKLISNLDVETQSPRQTSIDRADALFATSSIYSVSFGGSGEKAETYFGHAYLPGQFRNALVTILKKERYGVINGGLRPGLWLDGRGALAVSDEQDPLIQQDEFTIETWLKWLDLPTTAGTILRKRNGADDSIYLFKGSDKKIHTTLRGVSTGTSLVSTTLVVPDMWYHVSVVLSDSQLRLYINGQLEDSKPFVGPVAYPSTSPLYIGASYIGSLYSPLSGILDEFRVSSVARYQTNFTPQTAPFISDSDTTLLLDFSGSLKDSSPNNYQVTPYGISEYTDDNIVPPATPTPTIISTPTPTITPTPTLPVAVFLEEFTAQWVNEKQVSIDWTTTAEINNTGFNLWRGTSPRLPTTKLNKQIIPSCSPGGTQGCTYHWNDTVKRLSNDAPYYYWLEDIDTSGHVTRHGPVGTDGSGGP